MLDTGATLSIVAECLLKTFKKTKTVAIRGGMGEPSVPWAVSLCLFVFATNL